MRQCPPKRKYSEIDFAAALEAFEEDERYQALPLKWFVKDAGERGWLLYEGAAEGDEGEAIVYQPARFVADTVAEKHNTRLVADAQQLMELRREALKGICVYCGEIQQYESLEQKDNDEGRQIRIAHIRQCPQRPELRLIAYCEELQEAANAAFKCLCGTGDKTIDQVKDQLRAALNPSHLPKETQ